MDALRRDASRISEAAQVGPSTPDGVCILNPYRDMGVRLADMMRARGLR